MRSTHIALIIPLALPALAASAAPAPGQLALNAQVQYSTVIQGGQDPVYGFVYNTAPTGSAAANYKLSSNQSYVSPISYSGSKSADGGTGYTILPFTLNSSQVAPANNVPVSLTLTNTDTNAAVTLGGTVNVLAHATPGLVLSGKVVPLSVPSVTKFATTPGENASMPDLSNASLPPQEAGTEGPAGGFAPGMIGDPPGEPTAELDIDSITASGDSQLALGDPPLFDDLPSTDSASENVFPFYVELFTDVPGTYTDTFTLHYSDEQDLPGADAPGSEAISFAVTGTLDSSDNINWEVDTDVPEPAGGAILFLGGMPFLSRRVRRRIQVGVR
jgi:hypothetical protein